MGHWAQNQASAMFIPVLWPEPCRTWVRWTEEAPSWSGESKGSGEILDEGMVSDLLSGVLSSGIIGEHVELLNWQMEFKKWLNKRVPLIVANVY